MPFQKSENPNKVCLSIENEDSQSSVLVDLKGATVISWVVNGQEILFLSSKADRTTNKAIRGGIPLVFPQFGKVEGPNPAENLPHHGFARNSKWKLDETNCSETSEFISASFCLDSLDVQEQLPEVSAVWPYSFELTYTVCLSAFSLSTSFIATTTSKTELPITPLLHSYFLAKDISQVSIKGIQKGSFLDKTKPETIIQDFYEEEMSINREVDQIHFDAFGDNKVTLKFGSGMPYQLEFLSTGLPDVVVWNPWVEKSKSTQDLEDDDYLRFLCVELGKIKEPFMLSESAPLNFLQKINFVKQ